MASELERLHKEAKYLLSKTELEAKETFSGVEDHLIQVQDEYFRVSQLAGQAGAIIDKIDRDFKEKTKLHSRDIILLFLCTALQCARQYLLSGKEFRLTAQQGDKLMENTVGRAIGAAKRPEWNEVLFQSVPYDAIRTGPAISGTGLAGTTHRYRTLGHDPVLGWIFGTANIMTSSLTKTNFVTTYQVSNNIIVSYYPQGTVGMINNAMQYARADPLLLPASVARQAIHFGSDYFTKQGLPIPVIATVSDDLARVMLTKGHIDMWSLC